MVQLTKCDTPIAFFIFCRPDTTQRVFERIREVQPRQLFVVADGPRKGVKEDFELCAQTRAIIERVDWDCDVFKNYAETNQGLRNRVSSGLAWVFEQVDRAIVLEDDCLPERSFFKFCGELLEQYESDTRIMSITGTNFQQGRRRTNDSYYFSRYESCWGWATWRRAWRHFDRDLTGWPQLVENGTFAHVFESAGVQKYWESIFQKLYLGEINSWAYAWSFAHFVNHGLAIIPAHNLVSNIGFDERGTHTVSADSALANMGSAEMSFPLLHPGAVIRNRVADHFYERCVMGVRPIHERILRRAERELKHVFRVAVSTSLFSRNSS